MNVITGAPFGGTPDNDMIAWAMDVLEQDNPRENDRAAAMTILSVESDAQASAMAQPAD